MLETTYLLLPEPFSPSLAHLLAYWFAVLSIVRPHLANHANAESALDGTNAFVALCVLARERRSPL